MLNINDILTLSLTLFAVIDILGSVPVIISLRAETGHIKSEKVTLISGLIMITFLFTGEKFLHIIGIDVSSFAIAGSVVIFLIAMEMILERRLFGKSENGSSATIVPIAFPLIAGAGTLTTLISMRASYDIPEILIALGVNLIVVYVVLKTTGPIGRLLGPGGIAILRRVFGIVLLAIAIKLFKTHMML